MNLYKKILLGASAIGMMLSMSGCSSAITGFGKYTGTSVDGTKYELKNADFDISKDVPKLKFSKEKAYIVQKRADILMEVIDGKVTLVNYAPDILHSFAMEITEGKHTYVDFASCNPYQVTIDAKKGYVYVLKKYAVRPGTMSFCKQQFRFGKALYYKKTDQYVYPNRVLVEENRAKSQAIIDSSRYQREYDAFLEDIKDGDIDPRLDYHIKADEGIKIK